MKKLKHFFDYANAMPEYPANDTTDWSDPDYTSFQKTLLPTLGKRIVDLLGFKLYKIFPVEDFVRLLQDATVYRERVFSRGRLVQKMTPEPGSSFIIWGELNGAFHSLLRCLNQLMQQGVIDDNFKIIKPLTYFVFNGDIAHRSPYVIETLTLVLLLMEQNPKKVFYLKGQVEDKQEWMTGTLGREMRIRARAFSEEKIPFSSMFRRFFGTLPLALYLMPPDQTGKEKKIVRISFFGTETNELEESDFPYFFDVYSKPVISLLKKVPQETDVSTKVVAYISAEDRSRKFTSTEGLSLLSQNDDETLWAVLSSPTASFRRLYQFFDDAFVVLNVAEQLGDWTLTLYHQDVREMAGFIKERPFYLISGKQIEDKHQVEIAELQDELTALTKDNEALQEGCSLVKKSADHSLEQVSDQQAEGGMSALQNGNLVFGSTMDLSKQLKNYSGFLKQGLNLSIDRFNKSGGLDGMKLQLIYLDDGYEPRKARANVEKLLSEFKTNVTLGSMGAPTLGGYIDLIKDKKILVIFPNTGSFRDPNLEYLLHLRVSYFDAGSAVTDFVIERNPEAERFAFLYQDDKWGQDLLDGAKQALAEAGIKDVLVTPYTRNDSGSFQNAAQQIAAFKPDAVGFFGAPRVVQTVMKELNGDFLASKILFGDTVLGKQTFMDFIKEKGINITIAQAVPNPTSSDLEIVQEFRKHAARAGVPTDTVSLEGYITGQVFLYFMDQIKDDLSIENFIKVVEATKEQDFKGLKLNFNPNNRQLLHTVWMNTGDEWIERNVKPYQADKKIAPTAEKEEPVDGQVSKQVEDEEQEKTPKKSEKLKQELKKADTKPLLSIHDDILDIGSTMDLSKGVKSLSTAYKDGITLKINQINLNR